MGIKISHAGLARISNDILEFCMCPFCKEELIGKSYKDSNSYIDSKPIKPIIEDFYLITCKNKCFLKFGKDKRYVLSKLLSRNNWNFGDGSTSGPKGKEYGCYFCGHEEIKTFDIEDHILKNFYPKNHCTCTYCGTVYSKEKFKLKKKPEYIPYSEAG